MKQLACFLFGLFSATVSISQLVLDYGQPKIYNLAHSIKKGGSFQVTVNGLTANQLSAFLKESKIRVLNSKGEVELSLVSIEERNKTAKVNFPDGRVENLDITKFAGALDSGAILEFIPYLGKDQS